MTASPPDPASPPQSQTPAKAGTRGAVATAKTGGDGRSAPVAKTEASPGLKRAGGSDVPEWNNTVLNTVLDTIWTPRNSPEELKTKHHRAALAAMQAFKPSDEIEGMIAAQATAMHLASMECFRRAMIPEQPADIASKLRKDGANLARGMAEMLDALDRKRGKSGQQKVTVEHVHVHAGGQAIVGAVTGGPRGEGITPAARVNPVHRLPHWTTTLPLAQSSPRCEAQTRRRSACQSPAMANGRCRMHGGASTGPRTAEGVERIRKARTKHGGYGAEMRRLRSIVSELRRLEAKASERF